MTRSNLPAKPPVTRFSEITAESALTGWSGRKDDTAASLLLKTLCYPAKPGEEKAVLDYLLPKFEKTYNVQLLGILGEAILSHARTFAEHSPSLPEAAHYVSRVAYHCAGTKLGTEATTLHGVYTGPAIPDRPHAARTSNVTPLPSRANGPK